MEALWPILQPIVAGQLRHIAGVAGGYLIGAGALDQADENAFVKILAGIAMWVLVAAWSWWQKVGQARLLALVAKSPAVAPRTATTAEAVRAAKAVATVLLVAFVCSLFLAGGPAQAAGACAFPLDPLKLCGRLSGDAGTDVGRVWQRIEAATSADLVYAIAMAKAANTNGSRQRLQCLEAIKAAKDQAEGVGLVDAAGKPLAKPDPALVTNIESMAELMDNLSPQGALFTSCAGAAQLARMNALQVVNAIVTGAVGIAALPAGF